MKMTIALVVLVPLTEVAGAQAKQQTRSTLNQGLAPYVVGSIQTAPGSNIENYKAGVGLESSSKHILLDVNGSYDSCTSQRVLVRRGPCRCRAITNSTNSSAVCSSV
jgi:hypothetical protein